MPFPSGGASPDRSGSIVGQVHLAYKRIIAYRLGIGMYLCVVVVTCTGIIVSKISSKPNEDTPEEKEE